MPKELVFYCRLHSIVHNKTLIPFSYCYNNSQLYMLPLILTERRQSEILSESKHRHPFPVSRSTCVELYATQD